MENSKKKKKKKKILMYEDYCLYMEETRFCFEISNSPKYHHLVEQLVEHRTSKPKVAGSNPSRAK